MKTFNLRKILSLTLALLVLAASFVACTPKDTPATAETKAESNVFTVGICQLVQHEALDNATKGFQDKLTELMGEGNVKFDLQNAAGDSGTCTTIVNGFVTKKVDLIMANATPALQAAYNATQTIPILGTSITEYGTALELTDFDGTVGGNVSGTSDLAPLDEQASVITELFPEAKTVALLYCSAEANSKYQVEVMEKELAKSGITTTRFSFADSNDVAAVTTKATSCDVIYIPTDNTAASSAETIANIVRNAKTPVVAGEAGICKVCGVATVSIDYYDLGVKTAEMAAKILKGEANVSEMPIDYAPAKKQFNKEIAEELGVVIPESYEAI